MPNFPSTQSGMSPKRLVVLLGALVVCVVALIGSFSAYESKNADEIMVVQDPLDGELHWYTEAKGGLYPQWFGTVTKYQRRSQFWFSDKDDQGGELDQSIKVRFNDGGHGTISGSIAWEMPTDEVALTQLHTKYGSPRKIEQELIRTIVEKAVYMTGPLMSSKESYAERRNELIRFIEDQIEHGVYKTKTYQTSDKDPLSGLPRIVNIVEVLKNKDGSFERQDESPLNSFSVKTFNLSINAVDYDDQVEKQIQAQQQAIMQIQTASAKAREAEQQAITAEQNGRAEAAKAKWEQEVIKAKMVTEAQQKLEVAQLEAKTAQQYKMKKITEAEADAEYKRKIIVADGALTQKLDAWVEAQKAWASAFSNYSGNIVPQVVWGSDGKMAHSGATALQDMLATKLARELALDIGIKGMNAKPQE